METLGAIIDRLAIVNLKLWHCQELLQVELSIDSRVDQLTSLNEKNRSLLEQRQRLISSIDQWMQSAMTNPDSMVIVNPQNKIYGSFRAEEVHA